MKIWMKMFVMVVLLGAVACSETGPTDDIDHEPRHIDELKISGTHPTVDPVEVTGIDHLHSVDTPHIGPGVPPVATELFLHGSSISFSVVDGPIKYVDGVCRIPDDGSCGEGHLACQYEDCDLSCYDRGSMTPSDACGTPLLHLDQIEDPCSLWYIDKSNDPAWVLRANDAFIYEQPQYQTILLDDTGGIERIGGEACMLACKQDPICVGGFYFAQSWEAATDCSLLRKSERETIPANEVGLIYGASGLFDKLADPYAVHTINQGYFSVCDQPPLEGTPLKK